MMQRIINGYRVRQLKELYYATVCNRPKAYEIRYNEITGSYWLYMRLSDGPGMRKRLRDGTEMKERRVFLPLIKPGWVCVDVGAHVGDYTIEMASLVGSGGKVYSYEAIPHYYELLSKSIKLNGLVNSVLKLAAVGDAPGKISVSEQMLTGNLAKPGRIAASRGDARSTPRMVEVPVVRLDDEIERLDAIKIDCEGYEVLVLKGMERLLRDEPKQIVFLEVHDRQLGDVGSSLEELGALLVEKHKLSVWKISDKHCICTQSNLPLERFEQITTVEEFAIRFQGT